MAWHIVCPGEKPMCTWEECVFILPLLGRVFCVSFTSSWFVSSIAFSMNSILFSVACKSFVVSFIKSWQIHILLSPNSFCVMGHEGSFANLHATHSFIHCGLHPVRSFSILYSPFLNLLVRPKTYISPSRKMFWFSAGWFSSPSPGSYSILCLSMLSVQHSAL